MSARKPIALANWKMAMTVEEGLTFVRQLDSDLGALLEDIDVIVCPPFTSLWAIALQVDNSRIQLGGQNIASTLEPARTGEISASLLANAGCSWVMLGHWEVRRHLGDNDEIINRKAHLAIEAQLRPILFVGEDNKSITPDKQVLGQHLELLLTGFEGEQVASMVFVYEQEQAIGAQSPSAIENVEAGTNLIRTWISNHWNQEIADRTRIIYGGSVAPDYADGLLACPEVDGLGATRRGRDASVFSKIVRQIAEAKLT